MSDQEKESQEKFLNLEEQIDLLGQDIMAQQLSFMERRGTKKPPTEQEELSLAQKIVDFEGLSKIYKQMKSMGRVSGKSSKTPQEFGQGVMDRVRQMQSTLGSIVRNPEDNK